MNIASYVRDSALRAPAARAVRAPDGTLDYRSLDTLADQVSHALRELGVRAGDRVALWTEKSSRGVAVLQGILRAGAAYVPIDPLGPPLRARRILEDCDVRAVATSSARVAPLLSELPNVALLSLETRAETLALPGVAPLLRTGRRAPTPYGAPPSDILDRPWLAWDDVLASPSTPLPLSAGGADLAYILYTSGSTGRPKGVCLSHDNAHAFIETMVSTLAIGPSDRLSNHAPFHFDLSVFDLYAAFRAGGSVFIIPEASGYAPRKLVDLIHREEITIWYSVPSALILMMDRGSLCDSPPPPSLRAVLFAGEVFPPKHLSLLRRTLPVARLLNLYGPTETNVCTLHEIEPDDPEDAPISIGRAVCGDRVWARGEDGAEVPEGEVGELVVEGPTVMLGYWGQPPQGPAYPTGDLVRRDSGGRYMYVGRRDHMVKVRGHRVELGEIEVALSSHPLVRDVAVVAERDGLETRLIAHVVPAGPRAPGLLALKEHCAARLPPYMIVHEVRVREELPRTSTGKIDRKTLSQIETTHPPTEER
ncbi:MAG: amino acid adenylation domain-containing protein [Polyangiaceae bacterium]